MDWIERLLGFAPDDGDGSLELLIVVIATVSAGLVVFFHPRARQFFERLIHRLRAQHTK
jgi:hypothetical protein